MTAFQAEGCGGGFAASFIKKGRGWRRRLCRKVVKRKVDGPPGRRLWPPVGGGLCIASLRGRRPFGPRGGALRAMSFISRLRRSRQHRVSILSAYLVHPFPLRGTSPQGDARALRDWLSVSYGMISILLTGSLRSPPPIRLCRTSPYAGGRIKL